MPRMPRLLDTQSRTDDVMAAVNSLLVTDGPWGLTMRAIAKAAGLSTSSLTHHYGDREHMLRVVAHRTGKQRTGRIDYWLGFSRVGAFVPDNPEDLHLERAWQQWIALARSAEWLESTVDHQRMLELRLLQTALRLDRDDARVSAVRALLDGICSALCDGVRPITMQEARTMLDANLPRLTKA